MESIIRVARAEDGSAVSRIYAPYITGSPATFEEHPVAGPAMSRRIEETLAMYPFLVAEAGGQVIGYAYGASHGTRASYRWSVNVSVYLDAAHHRRGLGKALYGRLLRLLADQGFIMAFAGVTLPNDASVGLHEAVGFRPVGVYQKAGYKLGQWRDVGWWQRPLNEPVPIPAEPIPWAGRTTL